MTDDIHGAYPRFLGSEIEPRDPAGAMFHVIPAPLERSVSYGGGTRDGPSAVLRASWQLERWDGESTPCEAGIVTHEPVDCERDIDEMLDAIAGLARQAVQLKRVPVAIGGEHTATLGVIRGLLAAGIGDIGVVQIDAHADLRESYKDDPYSHASVMKRVIDLGVPLVQLGVRALCEEEVAIRERHRVVCYDAGELVPRNITEITLPEDFPECVYFTVDVDGLDPSIFPSTGTPVPGGLGWYQALSLFESVARQRKVIGFDLMEFAPIDGFHAFDFSAALLVYKMMGIIERAG